eukprot:CAMPEP_0197037422 /NCGR_PEP_ID=MMETSP1384-20130603/14642_1 /TAXON_ID=29189 /ORGANISM="Ammonia sp." /LENGTH=534 /DNA_ID=CAMNT_0042467725 /DNA_START=20 /DNA_END=1621 /DNA_ORIENTATION=-
MALLSAFALFALISGSWAYKNLSITIQSDGSLKISETLDSSADVEAIYTEAMNETGWDILEVKINVIQHAYSVSDNQRMFAAGVAEGYFTSLGIYQLYTNIQNTSFWDYTNGPPQNLQTFMQQQATYMNQQIAKNPTDPFWQYADLLRQQLSGLQYGYNLTAASNGVPTYTDSWPFVFLNLVGDLLDLQSALNPSQRLDWHDYSPEEYLRLSLMRGRCSAMVKITPEIDNLFIGHSAWFIFQNTIRIFKRYKFAFETVPTATHHMLFSSYPGYLESLDDFYIMDSGLAMLQTTNGIPNTTLYDLVTPQSLYAWQRVRIANALSKTGQEWYQNVANQNSGTYNNQYMVINYGSFKANEPLPDNFLWVVEQIPGYVEGADMTQVVERGYWGSFNIPAFEKVYNMSGYPELVEKQGVANSYDLAPRARIFRRDANSVSDLDSFKAFLRYNDYKQDPIENNDPMWAICSRGDLLPASEDPSPFGCYDTKVANLSMILSMQASVINGPTYDDLPPFDWSDWPQYANVHNGIPDLMKFDW